MISEGREAAIPRVLDTRKREFESRSSDQVLDKHNEVCYSTYMIRDKAVKNGKANLITRVGHQSAWHAQVMKGTLETHSKTKRAFL